MPPVIVDEKCIKCGRCVEGCPTDVFYNSKKMEIPFVKYPEECWHCNACVLECPRPGAIYLRIPLPQTIMYKE